MSERYKSPLSSYTSENTQNNVSYYVICFFYKWAEKISAASVKKLEIKVLPQLLSEDEEVQSKEALPSSVPCLHANHEPQLLINASILPTTFIFSWDKVGLGIPRSQSRPYQEFQL